MKQLEFILKLHDKVTSPIDRVIRHLNQFETKVHRARRAIDRLQASMRKMAGGFGGGGGGQLALPYGSGGRGGTLALPGSNIIDVVARPVPTHRNSALGALRSMRSELFNLERAAGRFKSTMQSIFSVRSALVGAGVTLGAGQIGRFALNAAMSKEDMLRGLYVTEGSHGAAQRMYDALGGLQQEYGVMSREEIFRTYQKQVMAGIGKDDAFGRIALMSDVLAATGGSMQEVTQLMDAIVQIRRAPVLQGDELNQLGEVISVDQVYSNLGKLLGMSAKQARDLQREGGVTSGYALAAVDMTMRDMGTGVVGELSRMFMDDTRGLLKTFQDRLKSVFAGVHDAANPFNDLLRNVNALMLEGSESGIALRTAINSLYQQTFGKAAAYLNTLVEDPREATVAITRLGASLESIVGGVAAFGRGIWDVAQGITDMLAGLRPAFDWLGKLTGAMDEGEISALRWVGRIAATATVFNGVLSAVLAVKNSIGALSGTISFFVNNPIGWLIGGITLWAMLLGDVKALGNSVAALMRGDWSAAWDYFVQAMVSDQPIIQGFFDWLIAMWDAVTGGIHRAIEAIRGVGATFQNVLSTLYPEEGPAARFWNTAYTVLSGQRVLEPNPIKNPIKNPIAKDGLRGASSSAGATVSVTNHISQQPGESGEALAARVNSSIASEITRASERAGNLGLEQ